MIKEALQYITDLANTKVTEINGRPYTNGQLVAIKSPVASALTVNTLSGLVDYLQSKFDAQDGADQLIVHVVSPTEVQAYSHLNADMNRSTFIEAKALIPQFRFGSFHDVEAFNIALQANFVTTDERATVLQIVGNIKDDNVTTYGDDGVSQQVRAKTGVATVADVKVPNPVYLKPYRTFVELDQPESAFVFRMRSGPECALFEADGGAWKVEAMDKIHDYLKDALTGSINTGAVVLLS
ncbi:hypothetical protein [Alicyclobacillus sp. ALC3]|uniref:hypothetical protein n=1 Tax=Alicyclobacillus sp. ALC3 TaxID=2796143 RepID=UPI0023793F0D|nr:hypothetical protein [Alicyclobacillus sp. ALC3]WDL98152.1 hypothetical protein JC200_05470 [Alicyclobacillus sp. ALC3]